MGINLTNFLSSKSKSKRMMEFQDLDHIDGVSISQSVQTYIIIQEMIWLCFISEMVQIMLQYTQSKNHIRKYKMEFKQQSKKIFL